MPESPPGEPAETLAKARSSTPTDARNPLLRRGFAPHPGPPPRCKNPYTERPSATASQTIRTIRSRRGAECCRQPLPKEWSQRDDRGFRRGGVCGTDRSSEHPLSTPPEDSACGPDNPFGDSLPPPQKYRLRDKPAFRTSTANPSRRQRRRSRQALRTFPATPAKYRLRDKPAFRTSAVLGENSACRADRRPEHPPPRGRAAQRTVGRPPQLRLHDPENDEDPTRA